MAARDALIKDAQSAAHLLQLAKQDDPELFTILTSPKGASIWATPLAAVFVALTARYGLDLDKDTCAEIAGMVVIAGTALFHYLHPSLPPPK